MTIENDRPARGRMTALIVGGSLGGLSTALALANAGIPSTVLERTLGRTQRGVAIRVGGAPLERAIGPKAFRIVTDRLGREAVRQNVLPHAWWDAWSALRDAVQAEPLISVVEGARITEVGQEGGKVRARSQSGEEWTADLLIGADGYRSVVRAHVAPEQPDADYAGYVVWLGQSEIPQPWRRQVRGVDFMSGDSDLLAVYPLIEADGGFYRYGWGWFDPTHNKLLREIGAVSDGKVQHTPRAADIPDAVYQSLERQAGKWSEPWRTGLVEAIRRREIIATPISEYVPRRVVRGHIALVGDAAHAQSPMTGAGFEEAVQDALALATALRSQPDPTMALPLYERARLTDMRRRVQGGQSFAAMLTAA